MSMTSRLVASFMRRLGIAVEARGDTISQLLTSHMPPRSRNARRGGFLLFIPEDCLRPRDGVQ
jgi:hypothetical protein